MDIYKNIKQGTEEWFEIKWRKIGGTLSKGLFVKSLTLLNDLVSQFLEEFEYDEDSFQSADMQRGSEMEVFAREYLSKYVGVQFSEVGWLQSKRNKLLGISPDGITDCETKMCETKCFGRKQHTKTLITNEIPHENINQCLHYFTVNPKLEEFYFIAYRPESVKHFIKKLTPQSEINMGTEKKPVMMPIHEAVTKAHDLADTLLFDIERQIELINEF